MGLDLWFREDVARILAATQETMGATLGAITPSDAGTADAYRQGFEDALRAVGVAFGVMMPLSQVHPHTRRQVGSAQIIEGNWYSQP